MTSYFVRVNYVDGSCRHFGPLTKQGVDLFREAEFETWSSSDVLVLEDPWNDAPEEPRQMIPRHLLKPKTELQERLGDEWTSN